MKLLTSVPGSCVFVSVVLSSAVSAADFSAVPSGKYLVDPTHAYINMQYNHLGLSNPILGFDEFKISMDLDSASPTNTKVNVEIVTDSIDTGSDIFNEHITGEKWFDTAKNPAITFTSSEVAANSDGTFNVTGDLTVKAVTTVSYTHLTLPTILLV